MIKNKRIDKKFTFLLHTYEDSKQTAWCLSQIRKAYPKAPIILINDGDFNAKWEDCAESLRFVYIKGERLKLPVKGPQYAHRMFSVFLEHPTDYLIKIDPDTKLHRPFKFLPDADFFGSYYQGPGLNHIQGGCQGFSIRACEKVVSTGIAFHDDYYDTRRWCKDPHCFKRVTEYINIQKLLNVDFMVFDMMKRIGMLPFHWSETNCHWHSVGINWFKRYAMTHPHRKNN